MWLRIFKKETIDAYDELNKSFKNAKGRRKLTEVSPLAITWNREEPRVSSRPSIYMI